MATIGTTVQDQPASVALNSARGFLNDQGKQIWTDAALLIFLQEAQNDLTLALWLNGMPVMKVKSFTLQVPANTTTLGVPQDMIVPVWLKERASGSSEDWIPMTETSFEPDRNRDVFLRYWAWREESVIFIGATTNREVLLRYWATLSSIVDVNSSLGFTFAEMFDGPQCAGYAASSVGNLTLAKELLYIAGNPNQVGIAGSRLDMILRANIKGQQNLPARRIPYRRFARSRLLL